MKTILAIPLLLMLNSCTPSDTSSNKIAESQREMLNQAKDAGATLEQAARQRQQQIDESTSE
ncbi:hypothetical protein LG200_12595 [Methylobacillus caricis]|uniref:hypothetical protein n=1 Tax=Methylobacillus caricis TaxID=1971611 RepID=UPI001D000A71|nr:hypothetical protein [Methylobacillus caricis]MCB5188841.1 hypothetical protein [Methylobacillus caricis]